MKKALILLTLAFVTHYLEHGITASGYKNFPGSIACPRSEPFGEIVKIKGKKYVCLDHTAKRYDGRYDIFTTETKAEAMKWGKKLLPIKVIK